MRSLVLLPKCPVPADNGSRQRLVELTDALHERGGVDILISQPITVDERDAVLARFPGARVSALATPLSPAPKARSRWLTARDVPLGVALLDPHDARREARSFASGSRPDVVFAAGAMVRWLFGPAVPPAPVVIDFADITSVLHRREHDVIRRAGLPHSLSTAKDLVRHRVDAARWDRFERAQAATASLVTVCSVADRDALAQPGAVVVPNGARRPATPAAARRSSEPPATLLFPGQMTYGPNVDGAIWFVGEVLPRLRALVPDVQIEIVGRASAAVEALASTEGVEVRGYVERMDDALEAATAVIVPLRQGSGTRIKIIEAWANHLPVVSTTVGAEGLGILDGVDALLADDAAAFATACARVLDDAALRRRLVENGAARYDDEFDWRAIRAGFGARVDAFVAGNIRAER